MNLLSGNKYIRILILLSAFVFLSGCGKKESLDESRKQQIEEYMERFISMYTSEAVLGEQRIWTETKEIELDGGEPAQLTVYRDENGVAVRYQLAICGETGRQETDYYLCDNFTFVSQKTSYYSCPVLTAGYDDILYTEVSNWLVMEEGVYLVRDDGETEKADGLAFFCPVEDIAAWAEIPDTLEEANAQENVLTTGLRGGQDVTGVWNLLSPEEREGIALLYDGRTDYLDSTYSRILSFETDRPYQNYYTVKDVYYVDIYFGQVYRAVKNRENGEMELHYIDSMPNPQLLLDYEYLEKRHKILERDICTNPQQDWENTILEPYLREEVEENEEICRRLDESPEQIEGSRSQRLEIEYFVFDFNDDGLEDYLLCKEGTGYEGSGGNSVSIYVQEDGGTLKLVWDCTVRLHNTNRTGNHSPMAVLDEKTDGYYALVLPESNRIVRYDKESGQYAFHDGE